MAGKPWYNNGINEIQVDVNKGEIVPDGFVRGRKPLTPEQISNRAAKYTNTIQNKSQEEKDLINKKRSNSLKISYNLKSDEEKQSIIQKRVNTMNNKSDEEKALYRKHLSDSTIGKNKGKEPWNKGLTKETDERVAKSAESLSNYMKKYAEEMKEIDPEFFNNWRKNINQIMRQNNSFNTSKTEEKYFEYLKTTYGDDNVIRQYSDDRYPFACDFYIPSEDLFIECNFHWTHGGHPFDELNLEDISKLENWQIKGRTSKYYINAIYVWTILDVKKQQIAKQNNLNYKVLYK